MVSSRFNQVARLVIPDMKKILLLLMIFFMTGCGGDFDKREKIIIGVDAEFAPMTFRDEHGEFVGFDIDLAKEAARRQNRIQAD